MRILITGATGFIGKSVTRELEKCGFEIYTLSRNSVGRKVRHWTINLLETTQLSRMMGEIKPHYLLHLAWVTEPRNFWDSEENSKWSDASRRIFNEFCKCGGRKLIVVGSCAEYDWSYKFLSEEETPLRASSQYSKHKIRTREIAREVCSEYDVDLVWARIFHLYGEGQDARKLIPSLISHFKYGAPAFAVNLDVNTDYLHVEDVARGLMQVIVASCVGDFNICSGQKVANFEIVNKLSQILNKNPNTILDISRSGYDVDSICGDNRKLRSQGWSQSIDLDCGLSRCVEFF